MTVMSEGFYIDPESGAIIPLDDFDLEDFGDGTGDELTDQEQSEILGEEEVTEDQIPLVYPSAPTNLFLIDERVIAGRYNLTIGFDEVDTAVEYEVRVTKV